MPRRSRLNSAKKSKKGISIVNKNSIKINFGKALGPQLARRSKAVPSSFKASKLSGSQQLLSGNNAHYGNPASRYIQAVPNTATIAYTTSESSLSNKQAVGDRLGVNPLKVQSSNPAGITVDNTPSKTLVKERSSDHIYGHLKSSNSVAGFNRMFDEGKHEVNNQQYAPSMYNPTPFSYDNQLPNAVSKGAYMGPQDGATRFSSSSSSSNNGGSTQPLLPAPPSGLRDGSFRRSRSQGTEAVSKSLFSSPIQRVLPRNEVVLPEQVQEANVEQYRILSGKPTGRLPIPKAKEMERTDEFGLFGSTPSSSSSSGSRLFR